MQYDDQKIVSGLRDNTIKVSVAVDAANAADSVIIVITSVKEVIRPPTCSEIPKFLKKILMSIKILKNKICP